MIWTLIGFNIAVRVEDTHIQQYCPTNSMTGITYICHYVLTLNITPSTHIPLTYTVESLKGQFAILDKCPFEKSTIDTGCFQYSTSDNGFKSSIFCIEKKEIFVIWDIWDRPSLIFNIWHAPKPLPHPLPHYFPTNSC